jgi:hypothetical protein
VRVENLEVVNSGGRAIQFEYADYAEVVDCATDGSYKGGIHFLGSRYAVVRGNSVSHAGLASPLDGGTWGGAIEIVASNDATVSGNTVAEVYGEGINVNHGSANATIEENYVFAARAVGIYLDAAPDATVRRNIVVGTSNPEYWRGSQTVGAGIALNNEDYHYQVANNPLPTTVQSQRAKIYGNLVAFTSSGIGFWGQLEQSTFDDVMILNNTLVDNGTQVSLQVKPKPGGKFINNILLSLHTSARDVDKNALAGMTARNNYFSQGDPGGDYSHADNKYDGLTLARMTGWRSFNGQDELTWLDFAIQKGSSVIGGGDDEPRLMSQGDDTFHLDFDGQEHNAPMDMGALRFSERMRKTPKRPTDIRGAPR